MTLIMEANKRKLLLIENQQFQFKAIIEFKCLKKYELLPTKNEFTKFIDNVRVWVNEKYNAKYRGIAFNNIKNYIREYQIELIIMDQILGGAHHCLTGIDLAVEINRGKNQLNCLPILFLSKTEHNEEKRLKKYDEYIKLFPEKVSTDWIHKGYFGDEILNEKYFIEKVIPSLDGLLGTTQQYKFWGKFDYILSLEFPPNQQEKKAELQRIRSNIEYNKITPELQENIESVFISRNINELNLQYLQDAK